MLAEQLADSAGVQAAHRVVFHTLEPILSAGRVRFARESGRLLRVLRATQPGSTDDAELNDRTAGSAPLRAGMPISARSSSPSSRQRPPPELPSHRDLATSRRSPLRRGPTA